LNVFRCRGPFILTIAGVDASTDMGIDAGVDASTDMGIDAGTDASTDTRADASADTEIDAGDARQPYRSSFQGFAVSL
jgi:hypothetical protein